MSAPIKDQVIWVTGATGAIGRVVSETLAASGARVVASARKPEGLRALEKSLSVTATPLAAGIPVDVTSRREVDAVADQIIRQHGRIDGLVNCLAVSTFGDFLQLSDEAWNEVLQTKLLGYMRTMRAVLPGMIKRGHGAIVNIAGRGGRQPSPAHLPGCCANTGVILLSKGLADVYGRNGIRINALSPGPIDTPRHHVIDSSNKALGAAAGRVPPLQRLGRPKEIADAVLFLLSPESAYITGVNLAVDGGGTATI